MKALELYMDFVKREFYNEDDGTVYNTVGKNSSFVRLYNAPWLMTLFAHMYRLTKDYSYLENILKTAENYYSGGGADFYPNGFSVTAIMEAFKESGRRDDEERMKLYFKAHADSIVKKGLNFPKHEVNYEQTIVTPAVSITSEYAELYGGKEYKEHAESCIKALERFNGCQPSFHLDEIPIRFWDNYWFGKSTLVGDTFPHYWSCLTARAYKDYYNISGDEKYKIKAEKCIRNCLCLFFDDGNASSSYVYPYKVNGQNGEFYDEWANDQDFALYFAIENEMM